MPMVIIMKFKGTKTELRMSQEEYLKLLEKTCYKEKEALALEL